MAKCYLMKLISCSVITIVNSWWIFSVTSQGRASTVSEVGQVDPKVANQLLVSYSRPHKSFIEPGIKFFSNPRLVISCMIVIFI